MCLDIQLCGLDLGKTALFCTIEGLKKRSSLRAVWKGCVKEKEETTEASELTGVNS